MSNRNKAIELAVQEFESVLNATGFESGVLHPRSTKPLYFRGIVPKSASKKDIYLSYLVTDNVENTAADNAVVVHNVFIDYSVYTRKNLSDKKFNKYITDIENGLHELEFKLDYGVEQTLIDEDTEIVISSKNITADKFIIMEE